MNPGKNNVGSRDEVRYSILFREADPRTGAILDPRDNSLSEAIQA